MKFDWYQGTIKDNPTRVIETLAKLGHEVRANDRIGKMYRYTQGFEVHHNERGVVASIACGGNNAKEEHAHAWASSDAAPEFAAIVRDYWPSQHQVTRIDSCQDFIDPKAFTSLRRVGRRIAKDHRMKFPLLVDPLNPQAGRTQYIGAPSSEYRGRLYEKGWEQFNKAIAGLPGLVLDAASVKMHVPGTEISCHPSEWVRVELQARPKGETARVLAAQATPENIWSFTEWAHEYARDALALDLERFYIRARKETTDDKALRWMCRQYANMLERLHGDLGDWQSVGLQIGDVISKLGNDRQG